MSQTEIATQGISAQSQDRAVLAGVALSSFAALLLELALTRLFSVVLFYHFAFLAISIALLGLGAGGVCAYLAKTRLARLETRTLLARLSALNAVLIPVVLEVVLHVPVSLKLTGANFLNLTEIYLASAMPFFITGLQFWRAEHDFVCCCHRQHCWDRLGEFCLGQESHFSTRRRDTPAH